MGRIAKSLGTVSAAVLLAASLFGGTASAAPEDMDYLQEAIETSSSLQSMAMQGEIAVATPLGQGKVTLMARGQADPLLMQLDFIAKGIAANQASAELVVPCYVEMAGNDIVLYMQYNGLWHKVVIPADKENIQAGSSKPMMERSLSMVKDIETISDNGIQRKLQVTLDGEQVAKKLQEGREESMAELRASLPQDQLEVCRKVAHYIDLFDDSLGDITYIVTIDENTKYIMNVEMDLTQPIRKAVTAVLDANENNIQPAQRTLVNEVVQNSIITYQLVSSGFNTSGNIVIPEAALAAKAETNK